MLDNNLNKRNRTLPLFVIVSWALTLSIFFYLQTTDGNLGLIGLVILCFGFFIVSIISSFILLIKVLSGQVEKTSVTKGTFLRLMLCLFTILVPVFLYFRLQGPGPQSRDITLKSISNCEVFSITKRSNKDVFIVESNNKPRSKSVDPKYFNEYKEAADNLGGKCNVYFNDDTQ